MVVVRVKWVNSYEDWRRLRTIIKFPIGAHDNDKDAFS